ncbi:hypothetical protein F1737_07020 [Methanoplanus sp. FWC-SCC4]|uniref:Phospholipase n=1 Tax=Methanochimaera problematica TaxID=2609417 RepID=A0AA97I398_9EURY|nr:hypothetical protein [Methanoplanus sp. FWC-SCC4]WOF16468.1 hypothetical protein F1737_07020 [Methanoplanus sp. FWC-SCC4]
MKIKKGMRAFCLLMVMIFVGAVFVPAVSAESIDLKISNDGEIQLAIPPGVTLNIDNDAQYRESLTYIKEYLLKSDIGSKEYSEILRLINEELMKTEIAMEDYISILNLAVPYMPDPHQTNAKWGGNIHKAMAYDAAITRGLSSANAQILYNYADDADQLAPPLSSCNHYANTLGPSSAELYAGWAIDNINNNNEVQGYQDLAYALHFMTDMSMPFHNNYVDLINHQEYESYVGSNWANGKNFQSAMVDYYYTINDVSDTASYLNSITSGYKIYISDLINYNRPNDDWKDDPTVIANTMLSIAAGSRYNNGLVKYVQDRT